MLNLDDKTVVLHTPDSRMVFESIDSLPKQFKQAFEESVRLEFPSSYKNLKKIVVCGMGGSRFTPYIIKELFKQELDVPYIINDDYDLPGFVDDQTLVILSSYSGTTEEVLACGKKAHQKGAKLTGISVGENLIKFLKSIGAPFYAFKPIYNPCHQPRIGFGYMIGGHLGLLMSLGYLNVSKEKIDSSIEKIPYLIRNFKFDVVKKINPAKQIAEKLYQKYPYYIVGEFLSGVGNAISNQTHETAKSISSFRIIPEMNHHLMEGLRFPLPLNREAIFIFFFSKLYSSPIQKRFMITKDVVEKYKIETVLYELKGKNRIEQVFELLGLGSYFTMYLSALYKQNPAIVPFVDYFKMRLREG